MSVRRSFGTMTWCAAVALATALGTGACGSDDDDDSAGTSGSGGTSGSAGTHGGTGGATGGKGNAASGGKAGSSAANGGKGGSTGGTTGGAAPAGGQAGRGGTAGNQGGASGSTAGDSGSSGAGASTTGGATGSGGAGGAGGGTYGGDCPGTLPTGGECPNDGVICSYGDESLPDCRDRATCDGGEWMATRGSCESPSPPSECPDSAPAESAGCDDNGQICTFEDGVITCQCVGIGSATTWTCTPPPTAMENCPDLPPNAGTVCSDDVSCNYPCNQFSVNAVSAHCSDGVWEWSLTACSGTGG